MNFLAHFHLAWPDEKVVAGALEGDYYKGALHSQPPLAIGIALHRSIDSYTDSHQLVAQLREKFPQHLRRYAGILIDLAFDHYLSIHWARFSSQPLTAFTHQTLCMLQSQQHALGEPAQRMLARMVEHDILNLYQHWETVPSAALNIGKRFKRGNPFCDLEPALTPLRDDIEKTFLEFYPSLEQHSANRLAELSKK
ncbi:MAG: ACP phosphodiesterase [Halioglobus sp.]